MAKASYINLYEDAAAYDADAAARAALGGSTISMEDDTKVLHYDGVNVEIPKKAVKVGDAVYVDGSGNLHFIDTTGTVNNTDLTKAVASGGRGWTSIGSIGMRKGQKAWILHKTESDTKYINAWAFKVTGYDAGTAIVFKAYTANDTTEYVEVTGFTPTAENVASVSAMATAMNSFLTTNQNPTGAVQTNWSACVMKDASGNDAVFMLLEGNSSSGVYYSHRQSPIKSGATATLATWDLLGLTSDKTTNSRVNGSHDLRAGWNKDQLYNYYKASTNRDSAGSPTDSITSGGIISEKAWNNNSFPTVKAYYGTWDKYLDSVMLKVPAGAYYSDALPVYYGKAKEIQDKAKTVTFTSVISGSEKMVFKAFDASASVSDGGAGLDWYMPGIEEAFGIFSQMKVDGSDPVNSAMVKIGSTARNLEQTRWVPARYSGNYAWSMYNFGGFYTNLLYYSYLACAVAILDI
jgi:hypothetical protein